MKENIWNAETIAKLADALKSESIGKQESKIGYSQGWLTSPRMVSANGKKYTVRGICSYASAMGILYRDTVTGRETMLVTDVNYTVTAATAKQLSILYRKITGNRVNLYDTSADGYKAAERRKLKEAKYASLITDEAASVMTATNNSLKSWNKITQ